VFDAAGRAVKQISQSFTTDTLGSGITEAVAFAAGSTALTANPSPIRVVLQYRKQGDAGWTTVTTDASGGIGPSGNRYVIPATLTVGGYDYQLSYFRPGETTAYASTSGVFGVDSNFGDMYSGDADPELITGPNPIRRRPPPPPTLTRVTGQIFFSANAPVVATTTPEADQTYDRWGNVLSATDPRSVSLVTRARYNQFNLAGKVIKAAVDVVDEQGVDTLANPSLTNYYDALGRAVATTDENGRMHAVRYDAAGQSVAEYHADGGVLRTTY